MPRNYDSDILWDGSEPTRSIPDVSQPSEFTAQTGPMGVDVRKTPGMLSASEEARLMRTTGTRDPTAPFSERVWRGEDVEKTQRQLEGERRA
jgi:hypothetical protein